MNEVKIKAIIDHFNEGNFLQAKKVAWELIQTNPNDSRVWKILGDTQIKLNEEFTQSFLKIVEIYSEQEKYDKAIKVLKDLIKMKPNLDVRHFALGQLLLKTNDQTAAKDSFQEGIKENTNDHLCYLGLGNVERLQGNLEEAIKFYNKSISIKELADTVINLGVCQMRLSNYDIAEDTFKKAIKFGTHKLLIYNNLGSIKKLQKRLDEALSFFLTPLRVGEEFVFDPNNETFRNLAPQIAICLNMMAIEKKELSENHIKILDILLKYEGLGHDSLNHALSNVVVSKIVKKYKSGESIFSDLLNEDIIQNYLKKTILPNVTIEDFFTKVRGFILRKYSNNITEKEHNPLIEKFLISLSHQCFLNEYIWNQTDEELSNIELIEEEVLKNIANKEEILSEHILLLSSYNALNEYNTLSQYLLNNLEKQNPDIREIITIQIVEPLMEKTVEKTITMITPIENEISLKVKEQYEKHPYPRWKKPNITARISYHDHITDRISPNIFKGIKLNKDSKVLVAGCGTGLHPISNALREPNIVLHALDLSLSSLAYGKRKAEELKINNILWFQADIMKIGNQNEKYDIIEASGVLHHMENPKKAFKILTQKLKPNGLFNLGLYARAFRRRRLGKTKEFIRENNFGSDLRSIKSIRSFIKKSQDPEIKPITRIPDFYSTSEFIDLLMHEHEVDFNITEIKELISRNYDFLGFTFKDDRKVEIHSSYMESFPDDKNLTNLDNWEKFENKYPDLFNGMYQFWLQKK